MTPINAGTKRRNPRRAISFGAQIFYPGAKGTIACTVRDISDGGAHLSVPSGDELPALFDLRIGKGDRIGRRCRVVWQKGKDVGVEFKRVRGGLARPAPY
jgi:hypothetical protein